MWIDFVVVAVVAIVVVIVITVFVVVVVAVVVAVVGVIVAAVVFLVCQKGVMIVLGRWLASQERGGQGLEVTKVEAKLNSQQVVLKLFKMRKKYTGLLKAQFTAGDFATLKKFTAGGFATLQK